MIRGREKFLNKMYVLTDILIIQLAFLISYFIRFSFFENVETLPFETYWEWIFVYTLIYVVLGYFFRLYYPKRRVRFAIELWKIMKSTAFSILFLTGVLFLVREVDISRLFLGIFFISNLLTLSVFRYAIKLFLRYYRSKGFNKQFLLILGAGSLGKSFYENLKNYPEFGIEVLGFLDDDLSKEGLEKPLLGKIEDLGLLIREKTIDEVVIALPLYSHEKFASVISICEHAGIRTMIIPDFFDILPSTPYFDTFGDIALINARDIPLDEAQNQLIKRSFDLLFSFLALIILSPMMCLIAVGIKCTSKGPVFFSQERIGLNRRKFNMFKFRTMNVSAKETSDQNWTIENDPRRTKFGTFLRKTSLDELPQFINVLLGDMSIVGPRPERTFFVEQFKEEIPKYMIKHHVRPGITGWAQVSGWRGDTSIITRIEHDLFYIENWTILFDIRIIFKTVYSGLINRNAY